MFFNVFLFVVLMVVLMVLMVVVFFGMKDRLIKEIFVVGMWIVEFLRWFFRCGSIFEIVWVVFVEVGIMFIVVVCV